MDYSNFSTPTHACPNCGPGTPLIQELPDDFTGDPLGLYCPPQTPTTCQTCGYSAKYVQFKVKVDS